MGAKANLDLFTAAASKNPTFMPLAERLRPTSLEEMVGQQKILGQGHALEQLLHSGHLPSMILWGPPGCGKTTFARLVSKHVDANFEALSAVMSGVKDLRATVATAQDRRAFQGKNTVLFIDEIHRFNKAQQDALLPHVESGLLTLIGATTENPSFEVNSPLLSRCRVFVFEKLSNDNLVALLRRALSDEKRGLGKDALSVEDEILQSIAIGAQGDARRALNTLEIASDLARHKKQATILLDDVEEALQHKALLYDKNGEEHYNIISAFIKSMRGSDANASVYWLMRMLESGEEPRFILRRMVIFASEDIGNADPRALEVATSALKAFDFVGLPEGSLPMTQAVLYLANAPKSNAVIKARNSAQSCVRETGPLDVPKHLRNAPTQLMKNQGYGKDYKYPHNYAGHQIGENYLPETLQGVSFYQPSNQGEEKALRDTLNEGKSKT